eukprot:scaffold10227_cov57-Phaeocystis_antarctica.AAC.1
MSVPRSSRRAPRATCARRWAASATRSPRLARGCCRRHARCPRRGACPRPAVRLLWSRRVAALPPARRAGAAGPGTRPCGKLTRAPPLAPPSRSAAQRKAPPGSGDATARAGSAAAPH